MKLIIVSAKWSMACKNISKLIKEIKNYYLDLEIKEFDYDFNSEEIKYYNVGQMVPAFIFLDNDSTEITRTMGEKTFDDIKNIIEKINLNC